MRFMERYGVEEPECNVRVEGYEVDFLWRRVGLAVELDGARCPCDAGGGQARPEKDRVLWRAGIRTCG